MYETSKEQEEKRLAEEAAKLKKRKIIDTIVVVIIVGIISAIVYANWDKIMSPKKDNNESTEKIKEDTPKEEPTEKTYQRVKVDTRDKINDTVELSLNGEPVKITYALDEQQQLAYITINENQKIMDSYGSPFELEYEIFESAEDHREYLLLTYKGMWNKIDLLVTENGRKLETYNDFDFDLGCYYTTKEASSNDTTLRKIKDGYIYSYIYKDGFTDGEIELYETKISIKDDEVTETETGNKVKGIKANCE